MGAAPRDIRDLCIVYGITDAAERERLMELAREGKQRAWWQEFELPYATYVGLEAEAVRSVITTPISSQGCFRSKAMPAPSSKR